MNKAGRVWSQAVLALLFLLAGCATQLANQPSIDSAQTLWRGRLALLLQANPDQQQGRAHSFSAAFVLHGSPGQGELRLFTPLGSTAAVLTWSPQGAALQQGSRQRQFDSLAHLTHALFGAELPLAGLFAWLRGQADHIPGWQVDLSQQAQGKIRAQRKLPLPELELRLLLEP